MQARSRHFPTKNTYFRRHAETVRGIQQEAEPVPMYSVQQAVHQEVRPVQPSGDSALSQHVCVRVRVLLSTIFQ